MNNKYYLFLALSLSLCAPAFANETFWTQLSEGCFDQARRTLRTDPTVDVKWKPNAEARSAAAMVLAAGPDQAELLKEMWSKYDSEVTVAREEMLRVTSKKSDQTVGLFNRDEYGTAFVHWLCFNGSRNLIRAYLKIKEHAEIVDFAGDTPLHYAISGENVDAVELLLSLGVNLEARNDLGETPLIRALATASSHRDTPTAQIVTIIRMLLNAGADVHAEDVDGATALHFAALTNTKSQALSEMLLFHGANPLAVSRLGTTPISNASAAGHLNTLRSLLSRAKTHGVKSQKGAIPPLHAAARAGHIHIVKMLLRDGANILATDANGDFAYDVAANDKIRELVKPPKLVVKVAKRPELHSPDASEVDSSDENPKAVKKACLIEKPPAPQSDELEMQFLAAEVDDYLNRNVRNRNRVRLANGAEMNVLVVRTPADGHCGFRAIGLDRQLFIDAMLEVYANNPWFTARLDAAMKALRVKTIQEWARAYARILDNGHAAAWLDQTHMELISAYFNIRFHIYVVDPQQADGFIEQDGNHIIYEGTDPETATDFDIAYVALADGQPLIHLERLEIVREQPVAAVRVAPVQDAPALLGANAVNQDTLNAMFQEFVFKHGQHAAYALLLGIKLGTMYGKK